MERYTLEDYNKVLALKKEGLGSLRISKKLGFPRATVEGWINCGRKPYYFSEKRIKACNSKKNIKRLRKLSKKSQPLAIIKARKVNIKPLKNKKVDGQLAYVLGVLLGDGHISQGRIILSAIDKDFVRNFKSNLEGWSKYEARFYWRKIKVSGKIKRRKIQWVCYLDAVEIGKFLRNFDINKLKKKKEKILFLRGFFDSEGSFSKDYELIAYNKDYKKMGVVSKFLNDLGLENRINRYTVKNINGKSILYYYLKIIGKSRYLFYQKIGFSIQRKQERMRNWVEKIAIKKYKGENTNIKQRAYELNNTRRSKTTRIQNGRRTKKIEK